MINRNKKDNESFLRERTVETMKANSFIQVGDIVLVSSGTGGYSFYEIVQSSTDLDKIQLTNGLFAILIKDPKRYTKEEIDAKFSNTSTDVSGKLDLKEDKTVVQQIKTDLEASINTKANKNILIETGSGLTGGGTLINNVNVSLDPLTHDEINQLLNVDTIPLDFTLATDTDIRNLFNSMSLLADTSYKLSHINPDKSKLLNLQLLSLFYDFFLQKVNSQDDNIKKSLTDSVATLNSSISLKEDKTKVQELITALKTELNTSINLKEDKTQVASLLNALEVKLNDAIALKEDSSSTTTKLTDLENKLTTSINLKENKSVVTKKITDLDTKLTTSIGTKANNTITVTGSGSLSGGGTIDKDVIIEHLTTTGHKHIPSGGLVNQILKNSADGTASWGDISLSELSNTSSVNVGNGLTGGGNIKSNVNINLDYLTTEEIDALLSQYKKQ